MNNYRLTVHVTDQPKVDTKAPKVTPQQKGEQQSAVDRARIQAKKDKPTPKFDENKVSNKGRYKVFNTLASYHKTKDDCMKELKSIRERYHIAIGADVLKVNKYNKELYNISFIN